MAYRGQAQAQPFQQGFRQDLTYEQIIKGQVQNCLDCFNDGDRDGLERSLKALFALLTPKMRDSEFVEAVDNLDDEWKEKMRKKQIERKKALAKASRGCPDLVPEVPMKPSLEHLGRQLNTVLSLLERKHMGLKLEVEESV